MEENKFYGFVELKAEKAESLSFCRGLKLLHVRDNVKELLSHIGKMGIFEEYTKHDISHIDEMLGIIEWLIPDKTKDIMTSAEWLMLTLAVYFHDLGMVVTKSEYDNRDKTSFREYKSNAMIDNKSLEYTEYIKKHDDLFLYQEFVRENHAKRIKQWIEGSNSNVLGYSPTVREIIEDSLKNLDKLFIRDLAMVCESHHKDDIDDFEKYKVNSVYGNSENERVNLNYIAIVLRIADLLHITKDRTPSITRKVINVKNPVSVIEWEKQMAVKAIKPKVKRNGENNVDDKLIKDTIEITAFFDGAETAEAYFGLSSYLQYTRKELQRCNEIIIKAQKQEGATKYQFPWREIDESRITVVGFETKKLQFTIDQDNILQLLVGHTLYNDSSVVVRELVQNAIDAVKLQKQIEIRSGGEITNGRIDVEWNSNSRELCFWDNGTGMTINDIENYLLKVGSSKYRTDEIKKTFPEFCSISHFGIGILTCFMIADDIDIVTNSCEEKEVNSIKLRKVNGNYLLSKISKEKVDKRIKNHGTMVKLYVRSDVKNSFLEQNLRKWIVLPDVPVFFKINGGEEIRIGFDSLKDVIKKYLSDTGISVDEEKYDVREETHGNVTLAYAVHHLKYFSDWCLVEIDNRRRNKKQQLPIGICVEGIRVEFTTPGYKNSSVLAIANIKNSKYQTNVARSALEIDENSAVLSDIYNMYSRYIQDQIVKLEKMGYSNSWALTEGNYLMRPLIFSELSNNHLEPTEESVLIESMAKVKNIIIEKNGKREVVSAEYVRGISKINIIECKMLQAVENLFKEIKSEITLAEIIKVVCRDNNFLEDIDCVITNYNSNNILHQYALSNKEVSDIVVDYNQRRIRLEFSIKENRWYEFSTRIYGGRRKIFVPKNKFNILGLRDEVGVRVYDSIYLKTDTDLYNYVINIVNEFLRDDLEENKVMLEIFLMYILDDRILEQTYSTDIMNSSFFKKVIGDRSVVISEELMEKIWNRIDLNEFAEIILRKNYSLYSIDNWSREKSARMLNDFF